ncbi:ankyrin [Hypoxylon sp. FL1857]|nr:ankyrin [Hypoxylon sp. FL1857]
MGSRWLTYTPIAPPGNSATHHNGVTNDGTGRSSANSNASSNGDVNYANIAMCPVEIINQIGEGLSQRDKASLGQTCHRLCDIMTDMMRKEDATQDYHALWWACYRDCSTLLKQLLDREPRLVNYRFETVHPPSNFFSYSKGLTPLIITMRYGSYHAMKVLFMSGADVNLCDKYPESSLGPQFYYHHLRWYPMNWAAVLTHHRDFEVLLRNLLKRGANINQAPMPALPEDQVGAYVSTAFGDSMPLFGMLNLYPTTSTAMMLSFPLYQEQLDAHRSKLATLLKLGADPNAIDPATRHTPIYRFATTLKDFQGHQMIEFRPIISHEIDYVFEDHVVPHAKQVIRMLVKKGSNPNIQCVADGVAQSPLHLVCLNSDRYEKVINTFLELGVDINTTDSNHQTPIYQFMRHPPADVKILKRFMKNGAKVRHRDHAQRTPLHVLCDTAHMMSQTILQQTIKALINGGANPTAKDHAGLTPRDILQLRLPNAWAETVDLLRKAEARKASGGGGRRRHRRHRRRGGQSQASGSRGVQS